MTGFKNFFLKKTHNYCVWILKFLIETQIINLLLEIFLHRI
jgi:hypothetical protein